MNQHFNRTRIQSTPNWGISYTSSGTRFGGRDEASVCRDINDYRKYALIRALSAGGAIRIGVCWMLTPDDGGVDGGKLTYLQRPERHRPLDPELFDILDHAASTPERRRLATIEDSGAILGALYHNDQLPDDLAERRVFMSRCADAFREVDLIFFDPLISLPAAS